jgi:hypothetical protein
MRALRPGSRRRCGGVAGKGVIFQKGGREERNVSRGSRFDAG